MFHRFSFLFSIRVFYQLIGDQLERVTFPRPRSCIICFSISKGSTLSVSNSWKCHDFKAMVLISKFFVIFSKKCTLIMLLSLWKLLKRLQRDTRRSQFDLPEIFQKINWSLIKLQFFLCVTKWSCPH